MRNAGLNVESIGLSLFPDTAKFFGFGFYTGQDKTKTKKFILSLGKRVVVCWAHTAHSSGVSCNCNIHQSA